MSKSFRFQQKTYSSKRELADAFGIDPKLFYDRLGKGWSLSEALQLNKKNSVQLTVKGVPYQSLSEVDKAFGLKSSTVSRRLKLGWTPEEAVGIEEPPERPNKGRRRITVVKTEKGELCFDTFKEATEAFGVDRRVAHARIKLGYSLEQALGLEVPPEQAYLGFGAIYLVTNLKNGKQYVGQTMQRVETRWKGHLLNAKRKGKTLLCKAIRRFGTKNFRVETIQTAKTRADLNRLEEKMIAQYGALWPNGYNRTKGGQGNIKGLQIKYKGKVYASQLQFASALNIDPKILQARLKRGVSLEDAVKQKGNPLYRPVTVVGKHYRSVKAAAKNFNIPYKKVHSRLKRGWTLRQALGIDHRVKKTKPTTVVIRGKKFPSITDAAKKYGLKVGTVCNRIRQGWTMEEAFGLEEHQMKDGIFNGKRITIECVSYRSIAEAAKVYGLKPGTVTQRLKMGWTTRQAFLRPLEYRGQEDFAN